MSTPGLRLRHLAFHGPNRERACLTFGAGLNLIYGASDTGKSFVVEAIDFMLGGKTALRDIPERLGYDVVLLGIETMEGETFTLSRSSDGGHFRLYTGLHLDLPPPDAEFRELADQHSERGIENLSAFLLEKCGLQGKRVRRNKRGDTNSLSFRNLARLMIVNPYQTLRREAETIAWVRGFLPGSGRPDPRCLMGVFTDKEREDHVDHPLLDTPLGEMDVSPMVIDPELVEVSLWQRLIKRALELDEFVRVAIHDRLDDLRARARPDSTINAALGAAQFLLRLCRITRYNAAPSDQEIDAVKTQEGAPRQVFNSLKLWRRVGPDNHERLTLEDGVRHAFARKGMPAVTPNQQLAIPQRPAPEAPPPAVASPAAAKRIFRSQQDAGPHLP
jgi:AAA domain